MAPTTGNSTCELARGRTLSPLPERDHGPARAKGVKAAEAPPVHDSFSGMTSIVSRTSRPSP